MAFIDRTARGLLMGELLSGMALTFSYIFRRKATINYPYEKGPDQPALQGRACAAPLPERRGALHRLQAVRGDLPGPGDHHRGRAARGRVAADHPLRHRHDQVHLLRPLRGGLPGGRHRRGAELRVRHRDARGAALRQGEAARERRPLGAGAGPPPGDGRPLPLMARG